MERDERLCAGNNAPGFGGWWLVCLRNMAIAQHIEIFCTGSVSVVAPVAGVEDGGRAWLGSAAGFICDLCTLGLI